MASLTTRPAPFELERLGVIMEPDPADPHEAWGALNPACARKDGEVYLFPRVVSEGNFSRIGVARVRFSEKGDPVGVERLGYALEPEEDYERSERGLGGVEDPRVTFVEPLGHWVMAYTALSRMGASIALAISEDLFTWKRLGPLRYETTCSVDFNLYDNKDGMLFPDVVLDPQSRPALAILHRPRYLLHQADGSVLPQIPCDIQEERESIWIGYVSLERVREDVRDLTYVHGLELLATPQRPWESIKIGAGAPPIRIPQGWLTFYHGVSGHIDMEPNVPKAVHYSAGAMVLDAERPTTILYRSPHPVLEPQHPAELRGVIPNVVFPTGVDVRENGRVDVYYGMADWSVGAAKTVLPQGQLVQENL